MSSEQITEKGGSDELNDQSHTQANNANPTGGISFADTKPHLGSTALGGRDLGLRRELTHDEKELANAGYEELESKMKAKAAEGASADISEHKLTPLKVAEAVGTTINLANPSGSAGIAPAEAQSRLARDGPNQLTPPKKKSALRKYFDALLSLFNVLLMLAGILEYVLLAIDFENNKANEYLGAILIIVAFLNAFIEWYQGQKADAILASFLSMMPPHAKLFVEAKSVPCRPKNW
ncbi:hypothetical protein Pst134EB_001414 [Puccinia striiformis f. sp. tritici]|nr:hypothetical protein Pst134EB_001414 [Puccinia striiformis f. sp. tritici]